MISHLRGVGCDQQQSQTGQLERIRWRASAAGDSKEIPVLSRSHQQCFVSKSSGNYVCWDASQCVTLGKRAATHSSILWTSTWSTFSFCLVELGMKAQSMLCTIDPGLSSSISTTMQPTAMAMGPGPWPAEQCTDKGWGLLTRSKACQWYQWQVRLQVD